MSEDWRCWVNSVGCVVLEMTPTMAMELACSIPAITGRSYDISVALDHLARREGCSDE